MSDSSRGHILATIANAITSRIVRDAESPYQRLMKKVNDIDINYFEDLPRDTERLAPELNLELKERVKDDFKALTSELLSDTLLEDRLVNAIRQEVEDFKPFIGDAPTQTSLKDVMQQVHNNVVAAVTTLPCDISEAELQEKYNLAKERTLLEWVMNDNKADIINFYHALMNRTVWECKEILEEAIIKFVNRLTARVEGNA